MALIGRIFVVGFAFLVASLAAAMTFAIALMLPDWGDVLADSMHRGVFSVVVGFGAFFISMFALIPAMIVIGAAEAFRLRSVLIYAALGGAGMLALYYGYGAGWSDVPPNAREFQMVAASGIVAGLVYWLLAGRNAGRWCERPEPAGR